MNVDYGEDMTRNFPLETDTRKKFINLQNFFLLFSLKTLCKEQEDRVTSRKGKQTIIKFAFGKFQAKTKQNNFKKTMHFKHVLKIN